jgi:Fe(3+) dicitrate transport protein
MYQLITLFLSLSATNPSFKPTLRDSLLGKELAPVSIVGDRQALISGSGQYINLRKLEKLNQTNINNILRIVPGVNIRDEEGFGLRPNIGLRGTSVNRSAKITLMEDGILIAPAPYADPSAYYFPTFSRIQGVEVLKGSSQIKYGPYTIGGAVNLISTAIPKTFKGFGQLSIGSFGTNQQRIWLGDSRKNIDYVFEVNRIASQGFKELRNGENTGFDRRDVMGKVRWHTDSSAKIQQALTLKLVNTAEDGNETYLGLTYDDYQRNPYARYAATQKDVLRLYHNHISLTHTVFPLKGVSIHTSAYLSKTFREWGRASSAGGQSLNTILNDPETHRTSYEILSGNQDGSIDFQSSDRTYLSRGLTSTIQYAAQTKTVSHHLQVGLRYHTDESDRYASKSAYNMTRGNMIQTMGSVKGNAENQIRSAQAFSGYLSYDLGFKGLKVSPGIRFEHILLDLQNYGLSDNARLGTALKTGDNNVFVALPGIGISYQFNEYMQTFGGVHKGFSPPGTPIAGTVNTQANSETSINYELGLRYGKNGIQFEMTGFWNDYDNILGSDNVSGGGLGTGDLFNAGHANVYGLELGLDFDLLSLTDFKSKIKLPVDLNYTYTHATFDQTFVNGGGDWGAGTISRGDFIPFITPHLWTASLGFELNKFSAYITGRYTGETRVTPGQGELILPNQDVKYTSVNALADFLIMDLSTNYKITKAVTVYSTLNNLTNSKAIVANLPQGYRPNIPLSMNLGLKVSF